MWNQEADEARAQSDAAKNVVLGGYSASNPGCATDNEELWDYFSLLHPQGIAEFHTGRAWLHVP